MSAKKVEQITLQPDGLPEETMGFNPEGDTPDDLASVLQAAVGGGADEVLMLAEDAGEGAGQLDGELPVLQPDDAAPSDDPVPMDEAEPTNDTTASEVAEEPKPKKPAAKKTAAKKTTAKRKTKAEKAAEEAAAQDTVDEAAPAEDADVLLEESTAELPAALDAPDMVDEPDNPDGAGDSDDPPAGVADQESAPEPETPLPTDVPEADGTDEAPVAAPPRKTRRAPKTPKEPKAPTTAPKTRTRRAAQPRQQTPSVLTIDNNAMVETPESREEVIWHEIHNAYRSRRILTGVLGGIEVNEAKKTMAIVYYKEFRIVIPMREMMIVLPDNHDPDDENALVRQSKIMNTMLGAHIDFMVKGIDSKTRSVVASRKDAMLKKRQIFYMNADISGNFRITEGRVVQARVVGVAEKVVRVEVFGVECSIMARDLTWEWMGDAHERYAVGDFILVRVNRIRRDSVQDIAIRCDAKSVKSEDGSENLLRCKVQGKYAGVVTDIRRGVVMIRLSIGVNAIAHACYDHRSPGKKDDVSFVVTHIDAERGVAVGIITRIIRQNL